MNNKQKEILHQHKHFLTRNIIWTDDLVNKLLGHGIITETILNDIQNGAGGRHPKPRVAKLLEVLPLRGSGVYSKFCNVLQINGHPFIADFLRDEESSEDNIDVSGVYKRVPALEKVLKEDDKKALETFVVEKVKDANLKGLWSKEAVAREKDKALEARRKQLEDAFEYEARELKQKEEKALLEKQLQDYQNEIIELKSEMTYMRSQFQENEQKYRSDFGVQMKFNMANESALKRLEDRHRMCEEVLTSVQGKLQDILKTPPRNSERDQMAVTEFPFAFVLKDFENMVEKYNLLLEIEKQYDHLIEERNYILSHLGYHSTDNERPSLLSAYRDFAVRTDEDLTSLRQKLEQHNDLIEGQQDKIKNLHQEVEKNHHHNKMKAAGNVWQNAMLGVMRKQLNDVKHDNRIKDTKIKNLEGEVVKLRAKVAEMTENERKGMESETPRKYHGHVHKEQVHHNQNGLISAPSSSADDEEEAHRKSRRNTLLPPLGGRILFQAHEVNVSPQNLHSQKAKPRTLGTVAKHNKEYRHASQVPDGLVSQQLRLENKAKLANMMSSSLGNLKTMHGKHGQAHVR